MTGNEVRHMEKSRTKLRIIKVLTDHNSVGILRCSSEKITEIKITPTTRKSRGQKMAVQILETLQRKEESKPNGWLTPNFRTRIFKVPLRDIGDKHEFKVISKNQGQNGLLGHREHSNDGDQ